MLRTKNRASSDASGKKKKKRNWASRRGTDTRKLNSLKMSAEERMATIKTNYSTLDKDTATALTSEGGDAAVVADD